MVKGARLTKTSFIHFLQCPKSFWLQKNDASNFPAGDFSTFQQKLVREGYEVERVVKQYFAGEPEREVSFQQTFSTDDGLFARADVFEVQQGRSRILYEIKSSTSVKTDAKHNHLKDACFQMICAERSGTEISEIHLIHLNGDYMLDGEIEPEAILTFADITADVRAIEGETAEEINQALSMMAQDEIDRVGCTCRRKTRSNHCDSFKLLNSDIDEPSIFLLPRISVPRIAELAANGIYSLAEMPKDFHLSDGQRPVALAAWSCEPQIALDRIEAFLNRMEFPFYFLDYETFATAVPAIEGSKPHKHIPVQYSLHILQADGALDHREFLARSMEDPHELVDQLQGDIGEDGSVVSWHASFEKTRNKELAERYSDHANFLRRLNERMVDLEDVFKLDYVDIDFGGSTSIKKVLPVVCPQLSYEAEEVQDGASAMEAWQRMIAADDPEADQIANRLLSYCKLDTFAMVEIYRFLRQLVDRAE